LSEPFDSIANAAYEKYVKGTLSNAQLREYYAACFQNAIDHYGLYQCWSCVNCLKSGNSTQGWGRPPSRCPRCKSGSVYEIASFQARSSAVGGAFASGFSVLMSRHFRLPLAPTPGNTRTHDFEVTPEIAIEAKGSPARIINPDGSTTLLGRPGLERSDTKKKASDNGHTYRQQKTAGLFFVVSNAVPSTLVGYTSDDITAIFDANKVERLEAMIMAIRDKIDLDALRRTRGI
jgi:hypothetical protein